jgi:serine/threonine-protein kinase
MQGLLERAVTQAREPVLEIDAALLDEGMPLGSYRLLSKLGEGGMGEVWRARHQLLARPCAIKVIRNDVLDGPARDAALQRFRLEATSIARLTSPNTVRLYDYGVSETGGFYFVMELLEGMDLFAMVRKYGPLPPERAVSVLRQACRSLGEAHAHGLLHRDIKPHNLFLCRLGLEFDVAKVLDFGLVKSIADDEAHLTAEGSVTGTPAFMPPERVLGYSADERSDLYSLACVGYWMLTGTTVFPGDPMAMMMSHARTLPKPPSKALGRELPEGLDGVILSCLAKDPQKRPKTAVEWGEELGAIAFDTPWTQARAQAWWREHQPALFEPGPGSDSGADLTPPSPQPSRR